MSNILFKKITTPSNLYNITQDYCHYVLLDLRSKDKFFEKFIRQSYWIDQNPTLESIEELIKYLEKKDEIAKINDTNDKKKVKIRRLIIIKEKNTEDEKVIQFAKNLKITNFFNRFGIFEDLQEFEKKYPFLVLSIKKDLLKDISNFQQIQNVLMKHQKQEVLYANSNFPLCVYQDQFFYGNKFHANSKKLLKDLNIKCIYEIVEDKEGRNEIIQQKEDLFHIIVNTEKFIDFENLWQQIEDQSQNNNVLFIESNPKKHFPSFLIVYFIIKHKLNINISTMKVMQLLGEPNMNLLTYNQAMNFIQGSVKRV